VDINTWTSISIFQTNNSLFQSRLLLISTLLLTITHLPSLQTALSLFCDKECNLGNFCLRCKFPTHLSSQNLTPHPLPNFHLIIPLNQLWSFLTSQILHIYLHHVELFLSSMVNFISLHELYLDSNISFHNPSSSTSVFHFHFARRPAMNLPISLILNPPTSEGNTSYAKPPKESPYI